MTMTQLESIMHHAESVSHELSNRSDIDVEIIAGIVKCRRGYEMEESWPAFKNNVEKNIERIVENWNSRWMLSIVDTYADYGTQLEQATSTLISAFFNNMRMMDSYLMLLDKKEFNDELWHNIKQEPLWDGFLTFNLRYGDTMINLYKRMQRTIDRTPLLKSIFEELLQRAVEHTNTFSFLVNKHERGLIYDIDN